MIHSSLDTHSLHRSHSHFMLPLCSYSRIHSFTHSRSWSPACKHSVELSPYVCVFCSTLVCVFLVLVIVPIAFAHAENSIAVSIFFFFFLDVLPRNKRKKEMEIVKNKWLISSVIRLQSCWNWGLTKNLYCLIFSPFLGRKCFTRKSRVWFDFQIFFGESFGDVKF